MPLHVTSCPCDENLAVADAVMLAESSSLAMLTTGNVNVSGSDIITLTDSGTLALSATSCMLVTPAEPEDLDDFDRADGFGFNSVNWQAFLNPNGGQTLGTPAYNIVSNQLQVFQDNVGAVHDVVQGGWWIASDPALTTQFSELVYNGTTVVSDPNGFVPDPMALNMGGPCTRMNQRGVGFVWTDNITCYVLNLQENRNRTAPYAVTHQVLSINHIGALGITNLIQTVLSGANVLSTGAVIRLTAMNFSSGGTDFVCLRGYVNGVQKLTTTENLASATGITAGRVGLGTDGFDGSSHTSLVSWWLGYWNDWRGGAGSF